MPTRYGLLNLCGIYTLIKWSPEAQNWKRQKSACCPYKVWFGEFTRHLQSYHVITRSRTGSDASLPAVPTRFGLVLHHDHVIIKAYLEARVVELDPHHFGNPDPDPHHITIRIRIRIRIRISLQTTSQNVWKLSLLEHRSRVWTLEARIRIRISIRVKSRIRFRIRIK